MKVRRLTRQYGFSGYSIYRYLVNETLHNGSYLLLWCEEVAPVDLLLECLFGRCHKNCQRLHTSRTFQR